MNYWPKVMENDLGIRPAGAPDTCFYCQSKIGDHHKLDCVTICKLFQFKMSIPHNEHKIFILFEDPVPANWQEDSIYFKYNEGSWCTSNVFNKTHQIFIDGNKESKGRLLEILKTIGDEDGDICLCAVAEVEIVNILDPTPKQYDE